MITTSRVGRPPDCASATFWPNRRRKGRATATEPVPRRNLRRPRSKMVQLIGLLLLRETAHAECVGPRYGRDEAREVPVPVTEGHVDVLNGAEVLAGLAPREGEAEPLRAHARARVLAGGEVVRELGHAVEVAGDVHAREELAARVDGVAARVDGAVLTDGAE